MKRALDCFSRFFLRFRYPVALPEDVAQALGIDVSNFLTFEEFFNCLISPNCCPKRLVRFMPRNQAEKAFSEAQRKEHFNRSSLFSFYFNEGWMEFNLEFDKDARLRRVYIHHRSIDEDHGIEIRLPQAS